MPDFSHLLRKPAGGHKRPEALEQGDYPAVIRSWTMDERQFNNEKIPVVRFGLTLTGFPEDVEGVDSEGKAIELSKRPMSRDFRFTDEDLWRLDAFLASCGISTEGREYAETLPETIGQDVVAQVQRYVNQRTQELGNQIGIVRGLSDS